MNIPCRRGRLRISSSKSPNILLIIGLKSLQENLRFLIIYSITRTPIEESSSMTYYRKNFLISVCKKLPILTLFLIISIRNILKLARNLGNQYKILPSILNSRRINLLNPILMANISYIFKLVFSRKSDLKQISMQNHPRPIIYIWSGLLRLNQIQITKRELQNLASLHKSLNPHSQRRNHICEDSNPHIPRISLTIINPRVITLGLTRNPARTSPASITRNLAIRLVNAARKQQIKRRLRPYSLVNCQKTRLYPDLYCSCLRY